MKAMKTYSHLAARRRLPSEYELVTSRLHYASERGFEVETPATAWYARGSRLLADDWERLVDPRELTYARYTKARAEEERYVDGLLRAMGEPGYLDRLSPEWTAILAAALAPQRHLHHGLQMLAAYVGQMAPSGRITAVAAFQAADQVRRTHRVSYWMALLRTRDPAYAGESRQLWQEAPPWQPMRRCLERLLVVWDWGEALVATNLCLGPLVDDMLARELAALAERHGDPLLSRVLASLLEDGRWHVAWSEALIALALEQRPENREVVSAWVAQHLPPALEATHAASALLGAEGEGAATRVLERARLRLGALGLETPPLEAP